LQPDVKEPTSKLLDNAKNLIDVNLPRHEGIEPVNELTSKFNCPMLLVKWQSADKSPTMLFEKSDKRTRLVYFSRHEGIVELMRLYARPSFVKFADKPQKDDNGPLMALPCTCKCVK